MNRVAGRAGHALTLRWNPKDRQLVALTGVLHLAILGAWSVVWVADSGHRRIAWKRSNELPSAI